MLIYMLYIHKHMETPRLSLEEIKKYLLAAKNSEKHRTLKILHQSGAELNKTINFMLSDTYMHPHNHPKEIGKENIERFRIIYGKIGVIFFEPRGTVEKCVILEKGKKDYLEVLPGVWHVPVVFSDYAICYEEMRGIYNPATKQKEFATWAPQENSVENAPYLSLLKKEAIEKASEA